MRLVARLQLIGGVAFVTAFALLAVWMLWRFLPALAWASVLAIATWPIRENMIRHMEKPWLVAALLTLAATVVIVIPFVVLGVEVAREHVLIVQWLRDLRQSGLETPDWLLRLPWVGSAVASWWQSHLADPEAAKELLGRVQSAGVLHWTRTLGGQLVERLTILGFTLLSLFFLYRDGPRLIEQSKIIGHRLFGPPAQRLGEEAVTAVRGTVNGLVLVGLVEGVLLGVAYFAAGLSHPMLLGFATAILATVPFGAPLVFIVASAVLIAGSQMTAGIGLFIFGSVVVFIADHFVRPTLIGSSTRLPFLWVLLGIFGGLDTFGLVGLFLGPAVMSVLLALWRDGAERPGTSPDDDSGTHSAPA